MDHAGSAAPGRRARQAAQTRREILTAARRRFGAQGYAGTSLREIAADVGVSVQTVYDSVGRKPELVRQLNDLMGEEVAVWELVAGIPTETDPEVLAGLPARVARRYLERCGDIVRAAFLSLHADAGLAPLAAEGSRRHREGVRSVALRLEALGALGPGIDVDTAADTMAALSDSRVGIMLLDDYGFDMGRVEAWMTATIRRAVLE